MGLHERAWRWLPAAAALLAASAVCLALIRFADQPLAQHFRTHDTGMLFQIAADVTNVGEAIWWLLPSLAVYLAARLVWRNPLWASRGLFLFAAVAGSGLMADLLKPLLGRARPALLFTRHVYGFSYLHFAAAYESFPSGHAACTTGAGLALALLVPRYRALWLTLGVLLAFTRVIVLAHYLSDVLAAMLLAVWTVLALERLFARHGMLLGRSRTPTAGVHSMLAARLLGAGLPAAPAAMATRAASVRKVG